MFSVKLPNLPVGVVSGSAAFLNSRVYVNGMCRVDGDCYYPVLVYSTNEHKWSALPVPQIASVSSVVNGHLTLIGGRDVLARNVTSMLTTWCEEEFQWKQVLPSMPIGRVVPAVICHENLLLVAGGVAEDEITVLNTTDVLDLTTMKWTTPESLQLPLPLCVHHLVLCVEYLYLVGGATAFPTDSLEQCSSLAWRAKWSDVKQAAACQHSRSQPGRSVWTQITGPPGVLPVVISCGETLCAVGGSTRDEELLSGVYSYDTARSQWITLGNMSKARYSHCAMPLSNHCLFVAGGNAYDEITKTLVEESASTELLIL